MIYIKIFARMDFRRLQVDIIIAKESFYVYCSICGFTHSNKGLSSSCDSIRTSHVMTRYLLTWSTVMEN